MLASMRAPPEGEQRQKSALEGEFESIMARSREAERAEPPDAFLFGAFPPLDTEVAAVEGTPKTLR